MRKSTMKLSWDLIQEINKLALKMTRIKGKKVSQDDAVRYLWDFHEKHPDNPLNHQKKVLQEKGESGK